ncbi:MAG TPA: hypothetical protein VIW07_06480 [Candidatus Udaeobacter sp.]|jgi:hypothetical protein
MLDQIFARLLLLEWLVFAILLIFLVGLSELAWRMGFARSRKKSEAEKQSGTVKSAVLALLGLLLGFSFALAAARHDARRELVVQEANSIGTTARRAQLLPEPHGAKVAELLREYISLRIQAHREGQFSDRFIAARKRSADLQDRIWAEAVAAAAERPSPVTVTFITSLNETIDLEAKRVAAKRNHVPGVVWLLLLCVTGSGLWLVSYPAGISGRSSIAERFVFPILLAIVIAIITDIDTPRGGLIAVDERPLLEINETLSRPSMQTTR